MTTSHRLAMKKLLDTTNERIAADEARLLTELSDNERAQLIEEIADLYVRRKELMDASEIAGE